MHCNAFEILIGTVYMPLCANVHPHLTFTFFLLVSCLPQSFDVKMPSFFSHYWIPVL